MVINYKTSQMKVIVKGSDLGLVTVVEQVPYDNFPCEPARIKLKLSCKLNRRRLKRTLRKWHEASIINTVGKRVK